MPVRSRRYLVAAVVMLAAAACSAAPPTSVSTVPEPDGAASVELLDFEAPLLAGGTFRGEDLAGKDVAFWFWAPW